MSSTGTPSVMANDELDARIAASMMASAAKIGGT
jgi:hypothetical protein